MSTGRPKEIDELELIMLFDAVYLKGMVGSTIERDK